MTAEPLDGRCSTRANNCCLFLLLTWSDLQMWQAEDRLLIKFSKYENLGTCSMFAVSWGCGCDWPYCVWWKIQMYLVLHCTGLNYFQFTNGKRIVIPSVWRGWATICHLTTPVIPWAHSASDCKALCITLKDMGKWSVLYVLPKFGSIIEINHLSSIPCWPSFALSLFGEQKKDKECYL